MPTKRKVKKASLGKQKGEKLVIDNLKFKPRAENRKTSIRSALYFTKMSDLASIINPRGKAPPVKSTAGKTFEDLVFNLNGSAGLNFLK